MQQFQFTARSGTASPGLLAAVASGRHFPTFTLTSRDPSGNVYSTHTFTDVVVAAYSTADGPPAFDGPTDTFSIVFRQVAVTHTELGAPGSLPATRTASWDLAKLRFPKSPALLPWFFASGTQPVHTIDLGSGQVAVDAFNWSETRAVSGGVTGPVEAAPVQVTAAVSLASPGLFFSVASGTRLPQVVLQSRDPAGRVYLQYTLEDVLVSSQQISEAAGDGHLPTENHLLTFSRIRVARTEYGAPGSAPVVRQTTYDRAKGIASGPKDFGNTTFAAGPSPEIVLDTGAGMIAVDAYSFSETAPPGGATLTRPLRSRPVTRPAAAIASGRSRTCR
jgi:type VI protein secretion system component Hcp